MSSGRAHDESPLELFTTLARTALFLDALQRDCLGRHELGFVEFSVLRLLLAAPGRSLAPTALAERVVRTSGAVTKLIDRLEAVDYVERGPDPEDRRSVRVKLTASGARAANAAARSYTAGRKRVLSRLSANEAAQAKASLRRLLEVLEQDRSER